MWGGSVGVMRFAWRSLCVGMGVLGWGWGCGWVSEFWTSGIVYMLILTIRMSRVIRGKNVHDGVIPIHDGVITPA